MTNIYVSTMMSLRTSGEVCADIIGVFYFAQIWNIFRLVCKSSHLMYLLQFV